MTAPANLLALVEEARAEAKACYVDGDGDRHHFMRGQSAALYWAAARIEALIPPQAQDERKVTLENIAQIGSLARSDGNRTFDDCIRDLGRIDDICRALLNREGRGS